MIHGDISNRQAPIIAFNVDNLLFKDDVKPANIIVRLLDKFMPKTGYFDRVIDSDFVDLLLNLWYKHPFSIYLVSFRPDIEDELNELLVNQCICYTKLVCVESIDVVIHSCRYHYSYYFDSDDSLISMIGTANALNIKELNLVIR